MKKILLSFTGLAAAAILFFGGMAFAPHSAAAATTLPGCTTTDSAAWQNTSYVITQVTTCSGLAPAPTTTAP